MWFISVEVEQETSAPPPTKNPGSAPVTVEPLLTGGHILFGGQLLDGIPADKVSVNYY